MSLADYFADTNGMGVLATSDLEGNVDLAIYSRPYIIGEDTVALSMLEKLSYANIKSNPKAAYMFVESGGGYKGTRFYLIMTGEETNPERITEIRNQRVKVKHYDEKIRHLIYFRVERIRPLVGDKMLSETGK